MPDGFPCPNPACSHVFPSGAVKGSGALNCPLCDTVYQFRNVSPRPPSAPAMKSFPPSAPPPPPPPPPVARAVPVAAPVRLPAPAPSLDLDDPDETDRPSRRRRRKRGGGGTFVIGLAVFVTLSG